MELEYKIYDTYKSVQTNTSNNWSLGYIDPQTVGNKPLACLFCPVIGYGINERIGRQVRVHKLELRIGLCMPPGIVTEPDHPGSIFTRLVIFRDKQTNMSRIDGADIFQYGGSTDDFIVPNYFVDNLDRIDILWDKMICHNISAMGMYFQPPPLPVSYHYPSKYKKEHVIIEFDEPILVNFITRTTALIGRVDEIVDNSFHIIALSTDTPNAVNPPGIAVVYQCRTFYTDA